MNGRGVTRSFSGVRLAFSSFSSYSTNSSIVASPVKLPLWSTKLYTNADLQKLIIIKENRGKAGVYRWTNIADEKIYVGSSIDLGKRFKGYFNMNWLKSEIKKSKSMIYLSLLKNGYSKFSLEILEYCTAEKCLEREQGGKND